MIVCLPQCALFIYYYYKIAGISSAIFRIDSSRQSVIHAVPLATHSTLLYHIPKKLLYFPCLIIYQLKHKNPGFKAPILNNVFTLYFEHLAQLAQHQH